MSDRENKNNSSHEDEPMSAGDYLFRNFLYKLPIIGLLEAIDAASDDENPHVQNHAKAWLIRIAIGLGGAVILIVFALLSGMW